MTTNLGTAYVSVMPSMKGFGAAVESGMSGIDTTSAGAAMGSKAASGFAGGMSKQGVVIGAASALASKAFDAVASSADRAIGRVDTMQNYPKVMANLGYSADDAAASIQKMGDRLDGLPTALDTMVSMTQQLAPLSGSLSEATDIGLAFNDMMLAGGASVAEQQSALMQYTQALAKGKPEMNDWRALQQVMPGQLNQVAQAMLGAGKNSTDLYNALKDGTVTMNDFNQAVLRLDKEGTAGFASFEQQARDSTTGIQTAIDNANTRIAKGLATMIDSIGQENISGAINTLSSGIGDVAKDLGEGLKTATGFVKEHEGELKFLVKALYDVAPAAITAWGAFKVFQGGKALFSGLSSGLMGFVGGFDKLTGAGRKIWEVGDSLDEVGKRGGKALKGLGNAAMEAGTLISSMSAGAVGLTAGLGIGMAALYAYNLYLWDAAAAEAGLTESQQALLDSTQALSASYEHDVSARADKVDGINAEADGIRSLMEEYNSLVDANGNIVSGNEERADEIVGELASAMGVERDGIYELVDSYGKLGDAAEEASARSRAAKLLESSEGAYENATQLVQNYADMQKELPGVLEKSAEAQGRFAQAQQDAIDTLPAEALGVAAIGYGNLAAEATASAEAAKSMSDEISAQGDKLGEYYSQIENYEGLQAALSSGDAAAVEEWSARVEHSVMSAQHGTHDSLEKQVQDFQRDYDAIAQAVAMGEASLEDDLASQGLALEIAKRELDEYDSVTLSEKFAEITLEDGSLRDAQGNVYTWNGTELLDKSGKAVVNDVDLVDAQGNKRTWNGTDLLDKKAKVTVDDSQAAQARRDWDNWSPEVKVAAIRVDNAVKDILGVGNAAGAFVKLHAMGGFITDGPVALGRDGRGVMHVAGEAGRELVQRHADGTTSIIPIENRKYMEPFAKTVASMLEPSRGRGGVSFHIEWNGGGDPSDLVGLISDRMRLLGFAGDSEVAYV